MKGNLKITGRTVEGDRREYTVDYSKLPRMPVTSNQPSLRELFLLGWQYFLPRFPDRTRQDR